MANSEDDVFVTCEVCKIPFTGIEPYLQHLNGKKHRKVVQDKEIFEDGKYCKFCDITPDDTDEHFQSKEHQQKELEQIKGVKLNCDVCNKVISGLVPFEQHMKSKPHEKAVRRALLKDRLAEELEDHCSTDEEMSSGDILVSIGIHEYGSCNICLKQFGGPESYLQHLQSNVHKRKVVQRRLLLKIKDELASGFENSNVTLPDETSNPEEHGEKAVEYKCHDCDKSFSGAIPFAQHMNSKIHVQKLRQKQMLKELIDSIAQEMESEEPVMPQDLVGVSSSNPVLACDVCKISFNGPEETKAHFVSRNHAKARRWKALLNQNRKGVDSHPKEEGK